MILATAIGWGGFAISNELAARRQEQESEKTLADLKERMDESQRMDENLQRRLGCRGKVAMGFCMDPICMDSDAEGPEDPRYVRGNVKYYMQLNIMTPHQVIEDTCINESELREAACKLEPDGGVAGAQWVVIPCDKGCRDGACVQ